MQTNKVTIKQTEFFSEIIVAVTVLIGFLSSYLNHNLAALVIMAGALIGFCLIWYKSKNLFNFLGLMYLGFVFPLGMANLRWANYQEKWKAETWVCFILAIICYMLGYSLKNIILNKLLKNKLIEHILKKKDNYEGMFTFGVIVFLCILSGFFIKWWVSGSLPLFNWQDAHTYIYFMSGEGYLDILHKNMKDMPLLFLIIKAYHRISTIFMFQGWLASCAVYAYCVKCNPKLWKKIVAGIIIAFCTIMPYLIVIREIFMMQTVAFAVFGYMINKKRYKKYALVLLMAIITMIGFVGMSNARGYTQNEIAEVFEMNKVEEPAHNEEPVYNKEPTHNVESNTNFPASVIWIYTYFTCGYDNFNYLTQTLDYHTYGLMELRPFFSALQIEGLMDIDMKLQDDKYRVSPNVTIYTFLCDAYVDFGIFGVAFSMIFWGLIFGLTAEICIRFKGAVSMIVYGGLGHHIIFMAFVSWMGHFSYLCSFGLLFIYFTFWLVREKRCG